MLKSPGKQIRRSQNKIKEDIAMISKKMDIFRVEEIRNHWNELNEALEAHSPYLASLRWETLFDDTGGSPCYSFLAQDFPFDFIFELRGIYTQRDPYKWGFTLMDHGGYSREIEEHIQVEDSIKDALSLIEQELKRKASRNQELYQNLFNKKLEL